MRLSYFTIKNYKIIDDTTRISVDYNVTALVGKNESGKSAIMKAMWKSKNVAGAQFDKLFDYPRDRFTRERAGTQQVTRLEFTLTAQETVELLEGLPQDITVGPSAVILTTSYEGREKIRSEIACELGLGALPTGQDVRAAIRAVSNDLPSIGTEDTDAVHECAGIHADQVRPEDALWDPLTISALDNVNNALNQWIQADPARQEIATASRGALASLLTRAKKGDPRAKAQKWAEENLPSFIYFDQYGMLKTRIHLPSYLSQRGSADAAIRTQTALFEWSGLDPQEILELGRPKDQSEDDAHVHRRLEERQALLKSASFSLSGDWEQWWTGEQHTLHLEADGDFLILRVSDGKNPFPIPFEERSQGFQWFFSFYLVFLVESKKAHKGAILMLDEPGLHLHPTLQMKLINLFERISRANQLIYSTHLPFLVDGNHLDRVRTVHLTTGGPAKTIVSTRIRPSGDRETLFPLQAALGYSIAQTLFLGKRTLIVEGIIDYWMIKALSNILAAERKESGLHEDTVVIPAGGMSKLMPLASVMLASMDGVSGRMLVLLDSDTEGRQAANRLEDGFEGNAPVIMLATPLMRADATIEDMIPRNFYEGAVRRTGHDVTLNDDETRIPMTIRAMEAAFHRQGLGDFGIAEKTATALVLLEDWGRNSRAVPYQTMENARALIQAINAHFDAVLEETTSHKI